MKGFDDRLFGAVEAGGTKFICGIGSAAQGSRETARIETKAPATTLRDVAAFFAATQRRHGPIEAVGIASFGPLDLQPGSPTFGRIVTSPKVAWRGADIPAALAATLGVPAAINTDVNAAALAEARCGAGRGHGAVAYVTVGTGIGVGLVANGKLIEGFGHPEAGHLLLRRHAAHAGFKGVCPSHGDCLEGLASGPAILAMWTDSLEDLAPDHVAWEVEADYLGQLCAALVLMVAPDRIILGGGVMSQRRLFRPIAEQVVRRLSGYVTNWDNLGDVEARIAAPGCLEPPGLIGAYLLAEGVAHPERG